MKLGNYPLIFILGGLTAIPAMSIDMYLPAMPLMASDFKVGSGGIQLTLGASFLALALGQTVHGSLADRFGRKPPLYVGLILYALASAACALAPSVEALIAFRFIQGLGGCAGVVIARAIVRDLYQPHEAARMMSTLQLVMILSPILAPMLGNILLSEFGWRSIFWALAIAGLVAFMAVMFVLPETRPKPGHGSGGIGRMLRIYPILLTDARYMGSVLTGGCFSGALFAYLAGTPFVFVGYYHLTTQTYSLIFSAIAVGIASTLQINRILIKRKVPLPVLVRSGIMVHGTATALFLALSLAHVGGPVLTAVLLLFVIAPNGLIQSNSAALAMMGYAENAGAAAALFGTLYFILGLFAIAVLSTMHSLNTLPLAFTMFGCSVLAILANRYLTQRGDKSPVADTLPKK
jgi:DHA1 family bicyclomycin/chloramphenicol resistance-like MFS transporter